MLKIKIQYIFATTFIFASQPLLAQERIPTFPQQPPSVSPLTPEEEIKLVPLSPPPSPPEITGENIQAIKVKRFVFEGNTVFSNQRLEELLAPYIGKEITFSDLLPARAEITKLYVDNGYIRHLRKRIKLWYKSIKCYF